VKPKHCRLSKPQLVLTLLFAVAVVLCKPEPLRAAENTPLCDYTVTLLDAEAHAAEVAVTCRQSVNGFRFADDFPADWVTGFVSLDGAALRRDGSAWRSDAGAITGAHYRLDLDGMAKAEDDYDSAKRSGASVTVDLSGVIAIPVEEAEAEGKDELAIRFDAPNGGDVATSLPLVGDAHRIRVADVDFATAVVFGRLQRRRIQVPLPLSLAEGEKASEVRDPQGEIELVVMDGQLKASTDEIAQWVRATALANADLSRLSGGAQHRRHGAHARGSQRPDRPCHRSWRSDGHGAGRLGDRAARAL
jgi:hypothetical protein